MGGFVFVFVVLFVLAIILLALCVAFMMKGKKTVYVVSATVTLAAWFVGLVLDANIDFGPTGFLSLRVLFPVLAMGLCILKAVMKDGPDEEK